MRTCVNPQFWQSFSSLSPGIKFKPSPITTDCVELNIFGDIVFTITGAWVRFWALLSAETTTSSIFITSSSKSRLIVVDPSVEGATSISLDL